MPTTPQSTDLPVFIHAEAAIKSSRTDYLSLFDPALDPKNLRVARADAAHLKAATKALKDLGFSVDSIGAYTLSISGFAGLFESAFGLVLSVADPRGNPSIQAVSQTPPGTQPSALVPTVTGALAPHISAILFPPRATPQNPNANRPNKAPGRGQLYLDNDPPPGKSLPELLGVEATLPPLRPGHDPVHICVVDTGLETTHPWFENRNVSSISGVTGLEIRYWQNIAKVRRLLSCFEQDKSWFGQNPQIIKKHIEKTFLFITVKLASELQPFPNVPIKHGIRFLNINDLVKSIPNFYEKKYWEQISTQIKVIIKEWREQLEASYPDTTFSVGLNADHGTAVCAIASAVAPRAAVLSYDKSYHEISRIGEDNQPDSIFNCSWGDGADVSLEEFRSNRNLWSTHLDFAKGQNITVVKTSGNKWLIQKNPLGDVFVPSRLDPLASLAHDALIVVGGAFRPADGTGDLTASDTCCAFPSGTIHGLPVAAGPHICGLTHATSIDDGALLDGHIHTPEGPDGWQLFGGTSAAAPQVAAACARLKEVYRGISTPDLREILKATAEPILLGSGYNPITQNNYNWNDDPANLTVGVVNVGRAVTLAELWFSICQNRVQELFLAQKRRPTAAETIAFLIKESAICQPNPPNPQFGLVTERTVNGKFERTITFLDYQKAYELCIDPVKFPFPTAPTS